MSATTPSDVTVAHCPAGLQQRAVEKMRSPGGRFRFSSNSSETCKSNKINDKVTNYTTAYPVLSRRFLPSKHCRIRDNYRRARSTPPRESVGRRSLSEERASWTNAVLRDRAEHTFSVLTYPSQFDNRYHVPHNWCFPWTAPRLRRLLEEKHQPERRLLLQLTLSQLRW